MIRHIYRSVRSELIVLRRPFSTTQLVTVPKYKKIDNLETFDVKELEKQLDASESTTSIWRTRDDCITGHQSKSLYITLQSIIGQGEMLSDWQESFQLKRCLPFGYFMIYATPLSPSSQLGIDGFDNYLAPVLSLNKSGSYLEPFARRMWVSGEINYLQENMSLRFGKDLSLQEQITDLDLKRSRAGPNYKMKYKRLFTQGEYDIVEEQRTFYYIAKTYKDTRKTKPIPSLGEPVSPVRRLKTVVSLEENFRISALTFNAHKIHYDKSYATEVEGYPNVVVSGPVLILSASQYLTNETKGTIKYMKYNILFPVFIDEEVEFCYKPIDEKSWYIWIEKSNDEMDSILCFESVIKVS